MCIDVADTETVQRVVCDQAHDLFRLSKLCEPHAPMKSEHGLAVA
ncbi:MULTISPECIES: hypothetical protein [unclassified Methylobacterium]|nr:MULTISPECIES: hypothetical protein [unclassified Methylobacterium]